MPTRDELTLAWGDEILARLPRLVRARYATGRFVSVEGSEATFGLPNVGHVAKCAEMRHEVEAILSAHFATPVALRLVVDEAEAPPSSARGSSAPLPPASEAEPVAEADLVEEIGDVAELEDAPADGRTSVDRLAEAFPGAQLLQEER